MVEETVVATDSKKIRVFDRGHSKNFASYQPKSFDHVEKVMGYGCYHLEQLHEAHHTNVLKMTKAF